MLTIILPGRQLFLILSFLETGQPKEPMDRQFLVQELNITEEDSTCTSPSMWVLNNKTFISISQLIAYLYK